MLGCARAERFSLHIFCDRTCVDAEVVVDGVPVGVMTEFGERSSHFSKWLAKGSHDVAVRRIGYEEARRAVHVSGEESELYLEVKLSPLEHDPRQ